MYDVGFFYVMDEVKELLGVLLWKDLLWVFLNINIDGIFVVVCMIRVLYVKICILEFIIFEVVDIL